MKIERSSSNDETTTDDDISYSNFGIKSYLPDVAPDAKEFLEKLIKNKIAKDDLLNGRFESSLIRVKKFELSGFYWSPLIKNGEGSYRITVENKSYDVAYSAEFAGDFEFQAYGFCTIGNLEKANADKISEIVVGSIKKTTKNENLP